MTIPSICSNFIIDSRKISYPQNSDHKTLILQNKNKKRDSYHTRYVCSKSLAVSSRYGWNLYPLRLMTLQIYICHLLPVIYSTIDCLGSFVKL